MRIRALSFMRGLLPGASHPSARQKTPLGLNRWLLLIIYMIYAVLTSSVYFGWRSMSGLLFMAGQFSWLCEGKPPPPVTVPPVPYLCEVQDATVQSLFNIAMACHFTCSALAGFLLETIGPKAVALLGQTCNALAWILLAFSDNKFRAVYPAFVFMGAGADLSVYPTLLITSLFPGSTALIMALMGACISTSFVVPLVLKSILDTGYVSYVTVCLGYAILGPILCMGAALLVIPRKAFKGVDAYAVCSEAEKLAKTVSGSEGAEPNNDLWGAVDEKEPNGNKTPVARPRRSIVGNSPQSIFRHISSNACVIDDERKDVCTTDETDRHSFVCSGSSTVAQDGRRRVTEAGVFELIPHFQDNGEQSTQDTTNFECALHILTEGSSVSTQDNTGVGQLKSGDKSKLFDVKNQENGDPAVEMHKLSSNIKLYNTTDALRDDPRFRKPATTFASQCFTFLYFGICVYFTICGLAMAYYQQAAGRFLQPKVEYVLEVVTFLSALPCIAFGILINKVGIIPVIFLLNSCGVAMYICVMLTSNNLVAQYLSVMFFFLYISIFTTQMYVFIESTFDSAHFGKLIGVASMLGGLLSLVGNVLYGEVTVNILHGDTRPVVGALIAALFVMYPLLMLMTYKRRRKLLADKVDVDRRITKLKAIYKLEGVEGV